MIYFDTSYIARIYLNDPGWEVIRDFAATDTVACSLHGRAETVAAFHRKFREGLSKAHFLTALKEFEADCISGAFQWLPFSTAVVGRANGVFSNLPPAVSLRAGDALHLASAAENRFGKVYSNDARLLGSATYFGLFGENLIGR